MENSRRFLPFSTAEEAARYADAAVHAATSAACAAWAHEMVRGPSVASSRDAIPPQGGV